MSEQTSNPTSGQNVPKSKFRRKSRQEQTAASKLRMERWGEKLDAAREKLAKQKPPKKPGAVKRLAHTAGHGVHGFVHGKLYEVEHENVGTEGAHRSELAAESVYRFGRRKLRKAIREHPAKAVERAESKHIKATADYYYRKTVEEHPEMQEGGAVSRYLQKQKIKRQYAKQAREAARQTAKAAEQTASATERFVREAAAFVKRHPLGTLLTHDCVGFARGLGVSYGIGIVDPKTGKPDSDGAFKIVYRAYERGLILMTLAGNVLRIQPPVNISEEHLTSGFDILNEAITDYENNDIPDSVLEYRGDRDPRISAV